MNPGAAVHLACAEVAGLLQQAPPAQDWLSAAECGRLAGMRTEARRGQFVAARWQARQLLAQVLGGRPQDWPLTAPPDAPPQLPSDAGLFLSLSHSGAWAACAIARAPLGLDLEAPRRRRDIDGLIALCCTPAEQSLFEGLAEAARADLFYQLWTVKEAWLKRRREWIAPSRLRQLDAQPAAQGQVRSWRAPQWRLALCAAAGAVRWWSAEPASSPSAWSVADAADLTAA